MIRKLGLDIGNSAVKGAMLDDSNRLLNDIENPSVVSQIVDEKYLTFPNETDFYLQILDSALPHFDGIVAIGQKAMDLPQHQEYDVATTSYKTGDPMTSALLFGSLVGAMSEIEDVNVKLTVSIPIVEAKRLGLAAKYQKQLSGSHTIRVWRSDQTAAKDITVNIIAVRIVNEGQAGFFGLLDTIDKPFELTMDNVYSALGEQTSPIKDLEDFIVVDIGEGTTDISVFKHKKFNPDYSFSITSGIGNILENARTLASREQLTIDSRKDLQRVIESTNKRQEKRREKWMRYVKPNNSAFVSEVAETIAKAYGSSDYFDAIIFIGGGFSALTGYKLNDLGQIEMRDHELFDKINEKLDALNKTCDLMFGVPIPYARTSNRRGLVQLLTIM